MRNASIRTQTLQGSPIRRLVPLATAAKKRGIVVHHLNIGQPDIPTPLAFMDGVRRAKIDVLSYAPAPGIPETLDALIRFYGEMGIPLSEDELVVTIGGSEAFVFALQATCDAGDEILIPEPFYPNYLGHAVVNGIRVVPITTRAEDGYHLPPLEQMETLVSDRTRAILFSNPGNPTGVGYTEDELRAVATLARRHDLFVISDEPYRELMYEGNATSILSLPEIEDRAILVDSISKRLSACGARIGCLASRNREIMTAVNKLCMIRLSAPTFEQIGLTAFLNDPAYREQIDRMRDRFRSRRDVLYEALQEIPGSCCRKPEGAFYLFVKLPQIDDSEAFVTFMLNEFSLEGETTMAAPGMGFYATPNRGCDELRLAYVLEEDRLQRAARVLHAGIEAYVEHREHVTAAAA
jgi:aspartate aminotransferase